MIFVAIIHLSCPPYCMCSLCILLGPSSCSWSLLPIHFLPACLAEVNNAFASSILTPEYAQHVADHYTSPLPSLLPLSFWNNHLVPFHILSNNLVMYSNLEQISPATQRIVYPPCPCQQGYITQALCLRCLKDLLNFLLLISSSFWSRIVASWHHSIFQSSTLFRKQ